MSKREYPDKYENKHFYGLMIPCMKQESMFAHKLCAITDRKQLQNRDLYDAYFMFQKQFPIQEEIITMRTGKTVKEYFSHLIEFLLSHVDNNYILNGLGELLDERQKQWVKDHLLKKLLFELKIRV